MDTFLVSPYFLFCINTGLSHFARRLIGKRNVMLPLSRTHDHKQILFDYTLENVQSRRFDGSPWLKGQMSSLIFGS